MESYNRNFGARNLLGIILIIIGGLYLLDVLDVIYFNIPHMIFSWPFILFIIGVLILVNSQNKFLGIILTVFGGLFLLPRIFPYFYLSGKIVFPIVIIALGLYIIFKQRSRSTENQAKGDSFERDRIDDVSIFGGGTKIIHSDNFKGGSITAIFGGSEIDLTHCKLAEGTQVIDVLTIFGGAEIFVPRDWNVLVSITPIFGGFSNKIRRDPNMVIDQSSTLIIKGLALFGGGEIKT